MTDAERIVRQLRKRKMRLIAFGLFALICLGLGIYFVCLYDHASGVQLQTLLDRLADSRPSHLASIPDSMAALALAHMGTLALFFGCVAGWAIFRFFGAIKGLPRDQVLIAMWDRIQELESKLADREAT